MDAKKRHGRSKRRNGLHASRLHNGQDGFSNGARPRHSPEKSGGDAPHGYEPSLDFGHTHNGQFFPGTAIIHLVWEHAYGPGKLDGIPWLVSSGLGSWGPPVRIGSDTEFWIIRFQAESD